jgi:hypothetical protein
VLVALAGTDPDVVVRIDEAGNDRRLAAVAAVGGLVGQ